MHADDDGRRRSPAAVAAAAAGSMRWRRRVETRARATHGGESRAGPAGRGRPRRGEERTLENPQAGVVAGGPSRRVLKSLPQPPTSTGCPLRWRVDFSQRHFAPPRLRRIREAQGGRASSTALLPPTPTTSASRAGRAVSGAPPLVGPTRAASTLAGRVAAHAGGAPDEREDPRAGCARSTSAWCSEVGRPSSKEWWKAELRRTSNRGNPNMPRRARPRTAVPSSSDKIGRLRRGRPACRRARCAPRVARIDGWCPRASAPSLERPAAICPPRLDHARRELWATWAWPLVQAEECRRPWRALAGHVHFASRSAPSLERSLARGAPTAARTGLGCVCVCQGRARGRSAGGRLVAELGLMCVCVSARDARQSLLTYPRACPSKHLGGPPHNKNSSRYQRRPRRRGRRGLYLARGSSAALPADYATRFRAVAVSAPRARRGGGQPEATSTPSSCYDELFGAAPAKAARIGSRRRPRGRCSARRSRPSRPSGGRRATATTSYARETQARGIAVLASLASAPRRRRRHAGRRRSSPMPLRDDGRHGGRRRSRFSRGGGHIARAFGALEQFSHHASAL